MQQNYLKDYTNKSLLFLELRSQKIGFSFVEQTLLADENMNKCYSLLTTLVD